MSKLTEQKCEACSADAPAATSEEKAELGKQIPDWDTVNYDGMPHLKRSYKFDDFVGAIAFANKVGEIAEEAGHHPKITVEYGETAVEWWTHKIKDLHRNDFIMAAKTDELVSGH